MVNVGSSIVSVPNKVFVDETIVYDLKFDFFAKEYCHQFWHCQSKKKLMSKAIVQLDPILESANLTERRGNKSCSALKVMTLPQVENGEHRKAIQTLHDIGYPQCALQILGVAAVLALEN